MGISLYGQNSESRSVQVIDQQTKEPVSFATVLIKNTTKGTVSNRQGFFDCMESNPENIIVVSCMGYETKEFKSDKIPNKIFLDQATKLMETVVVSAGRKRELKKDIPVAMSAVSIVEMENSKPVSIDEVLNKQSGVLMVDLGNEQHMMAIRQPITTKGVYLYLEDGIPIRPTGVFNHNALLEQNMSAAKEH